MPCLRSDRNLGLAHLLRVGVGERLQGAEAAGKAAQKQPGTLRYEGRRDFKRGNR